MLPFVLFELHRTSILEGISLQVGVPPEAQVRALIDTILSLMLTKTFRTTHCPTI